MPAAPPPGACGSCVSSLLPVFVVSVVIGSSLLRLRWGIKVLFVYRVAVHRVRVRANPLTSFEEDRLIAKGRHAGVDPLLHALAQPLEDDALLLALLLTRDGANGVHLRRGAVVYHGGRRREGLAHREALELVVEQNATQVRMADEADAVHVV